MEASKLQRYTATGAAESGYITDQEVTRSQCMEVGYFPLFPSAIENGTKWLLWVLRIGAGQGEFPTFTPKVGI